MILYRYNCTEHGEFESFNTIENRALKACPKCAKDTQYMVSSPRIKLEGITGHFPTAYDRFTRIHEKEALREPKEEY